MARVHARGVISSTWEGMDGGIVAAILANSVAESAAAIVADIVWLADVRRDAHNLAWAEQAASGRGGHVALAHVHAICIDSDGDVDPIVDDEGDAAPQAQLLDTLGPPARGEMRGGARR